MPVPTPTRMSIMMIIAKAPALTPVGWEYEGRSVLMLTRVSLGII